MSPNRNLSYQQQATKARHADLAPMKETIRNQGASYGAVSGHLMANSNLYFGTQLSKKDILAWAVKKHRDDPKNFLKNIGFSK